MSQVPHAPSSEFDRRHEGVPDVMLGGLHLLRSIVQPSPEWEDAEDGDDWEDAQHRSSSWFIYGAQSGEDENRYALIGDLTLEDAPWMIGVTVVCPLTFSGPEPEPEGAQDRMAEKYGKWASPVMWDFASNIARALAASVLATEVDIPFRTPVPHILSSSDVLRP
jgi:hypothetical protein